MLAITSSPLSWTGQGSNGGFSIVGYSLGGGIAANFTSHFPNLVTSLVLLAPAGVMRPYHISSTNKFLYSSGLVPENLLQWIVKGKMESGSPPHRKPNKQNAMDNVIAAETTGAASTM
jgi:pimeloyl-ACP methyl ester carboxylesterase